MFSGTEDFPRTSVQPGRRGITSPVLALSFFSAPNSSGELQHLGLPSISILSRDPSNQETIKNPGKQLILAAAQSCNSLLAWPLRKITGQSTGWHLEPQHVSGTCITQGSMWGLSKIIVPRLPFRIPCARPCASLRLRVFLLMPSPSCTKHFGN